MLNRAQRFHGYNALNFAYKQGQTVRNPVLSLKYALNPRRTSYRVAVVVSKKVSKSAVRRNRIRRRVYEQVRLQLAPIAAPKPYDLIFMVYSLDVATLPASELQRLIASQLQKTGLVTSVNG